MSYLGLTYSEFSSGERQKKGPITMAGDKRVRRVLVEAAWHYRHLINCGKMLSKVTVAIAREPARFIAVLSTCHSTPPWFM